MTEQNPTPQAPDIILYNAEIERGLDLKFIESVDTNKQSNCAILLLVTPGGNADAAYKIGKYLQEKYESFGVLLPGICKSAGTLLAIAGDELIFTPYGELGPLDVQVRKEDKLTGFESGLNISEAFQAIEDRAKDTYRKLISEIQFASNGIVGIKTALHAASEMVASLYEPILRQIDPEEVGSRSRAMRIGEDYAVRLNAKWGNLKGEFITTLSRSYPGHGFVIDYDEANSMFNRVRHANENEIKIVEKLGIIARIPREQPVIEYLKPEEMNPNEQGTYENANSESSDDNKERPRETEENIRDTGAPS